MRKEENSTAVDARIAHSCTHIHNAAKEMIMKYTIILMILRHQRQWVKETKITYHTLCAQRFSLSLSFSIHPSIYLSFNLSFFLFYLLTFCLFCVFLADCAFHFIGAISCLHKFNFRFLYASGNVLLVRCTTEKKRRRNETHIVCVWKSQRSRSVCAISWNCIHLWCGTYSFLLYLILFIYFIQNKRIVRLQQYRLPF